jgi:hypothetical protein
MRTTRMLGVYFGLLCSLSMVGCGNQSFVSPTFLSVTATPASLPVGGSAVLRAVAHLSDGTIQDVSSGALWAISDATIATLNNGAVTAQAEGVLTVQATYDGAPVGSSQSTASTPAQRVISSVQVNISADNASKIPTIAWKTPATISYGTVLSSKQLNATANVPGSFSYFPVAWTRPRVGPQKTQKHIPQQLPL